MKTLRRFISKLGIGKHQHRWSVIRTIWPFPEGYGTWCRGCKTLLDSGMTKRQAEQIVRDLNASH